MLPEPATFGQYLWYCAGLWFWWRNLSWMVRHACGFVHPASATYVPAGRRGLMVIESRIMVLLYAALFAAAVHFEFVWVLAVAWIAPRVAGEPIQRIIRVAEHVGCEESPDLLRNTRTTLTNRFVNAIAWQMPYHAEASPVPERPLSRASCRARARRRSGGGGAARLSRRPAADHPAPARSRFHCPTRRQGSITAAVARAARRAEMTCLPVAGLLSPTSAGVATSSLSNHFRRMSRVSGERRAGRHESSGRSHPTVPDPAGGPQPCDRAHRRPGRYCRGTGTRQRTKLRSPSRASTRSRHSCL